MWCMRLQSHFWIQTSRVYLKLFRCGRIGICTRIDKYSDLRIVIVSVWKKKCYQTVHPYWLDSWDVEDLPPKKAFNTTAPTATKPPLDNLQLVYMWLCTALLYEVVEDSIFLLENYGLPSDTWQRDHFENQNVRITSSEADKIKRNTTNLTLVLDSTLLSKLRFHTMNEVKSVHPRCIL